MDSDQRKDLESALEKLTKLIATTIDPIEKAFYEAQLDKVTKALHRPN